MSKDIVQPSALDLNALSELVERQLDEVAGDGYSRVSAHHYKQPPQPGLGGE